MGQMSSIFPGSELVALLGCGAPTGEALNCSEPKENL